MRIIKAEECKPIQIGRVAENAAEVVRFDVSGWPELYGAGGAFVLTHQRPEDSEPYVCAASMATDGFLEWTVENVDVAQIGRGAAQLTYVIGNVVAKSVIFTTIIMRSLEAAGDLPEPYESRIEELIDAAANITAEANRAETAREGAEEAERNAKDSEDAAKTSEREAAASEVQAQSWAEGGTGSRVGEDTNNAKFWAHLSQQGAETSGYVFFDIDDADGKMYVTTAGHIGEDVAFEVNENTGELEVIYA